MKKTFSLLCLVFSLSFCYAQTIGVRSLEPTKKEIANLPRYDTTSFLLDLTKLSDNINYYDGQKIMIAPNMGDMIQYSHYRGFTIKDSVEMRNYPDTVWVKKRKKVKEGDYYLVYPKTLAYKADYVKKGVIRKIGDNSYPEYAFSRSTGFYTPSKYIDGQTFTITSVSKLEGSDIAAKYCFHLLDNDGNSVNFTCSEKYWYYKKEEYFPALLMVSYLDKYREMYVGKTFHAKDVSKYSSAVYLFNNIEDNKYVAVNGDFTCTDISLVKGVSSLAKLDDDHKPIYSAEVRLFFKDQNGHEFSVPTESKYNFSLTLTKSDYENYEYKKMYYQIQLENMILASDYYAQKEAEKKAEELRKVEDQQQKAERKKYLIKKFGKTYADMILKGEVQTGMTAEMCRESWGEPDDINKTIGSWGTHEQWCYNWGGYLYIENGKLTAIQN